MSVHIDRAHHHPRVERLRGPRSRWSFPWRASCECGFSAQEMTWRGAYLDARIHSAQQR